MATGCSLLIRNLCFETSPDRVRQIFEKFGRVRDVYLPLDHFSKRPRGFGFVEFYEEAAAQEAMREMDRTMIDGNEVYVIIAQDRRKSPETMRRHLEQTRRGRGPERDGRDGYGRDDFRGGRGYARGDIREVDIRYAEANGIRPGSWGPSGAAGGAPLSGAEADRRDHVEEGATPENTTVLDIDATAMTGPDTVEAPTTATPGVTGGARVPDDM
ncbi:RNA recognition motif-containing protein [Besnoitia besnoiti]|uniref:RNA recognition motif-containing protein n=1 Tax=Besnoitia besnoiti TaxID=94643 RepID=A0A2A9MJ84_BESBE|nr:RNA recognition motif-containing protein [Besnoitia besnoiti]PFH35713.1 RNA recognition motif-containing protein [Besnoitia besnoiti]